MLIKKGEIFRDKILLMPIQGLYRKLEEEGLLNDGVLGQDWFATRIWTFDYQKEELLLHDSYDLEDKSENHIADIFFQIDEDGDTRIICRG